MRPLRVIHVCNGLDVGGMEKLLIEFARVTDRSQFDLSFIALGDKGAAAAQIEQQGWPVTALAQRPGLRARLPLQLASLFRAARADIVHTHNAKPLIYAGPAARFAGVRCIVHTRHGQGRNVSRRQEVLFNLASACADQVVSVSADSTQLAFRSGLPADKLATVHNGIHLPQFEAKGPTAGGPALYVGRLSPEKDLPTLLRATSIVIAYEPNFRLHIAGPGPCLDELRALAKSLRIEANVNFLGTVPSPAAILPGASFLVLPSLTEGISLALLEAMATAVPTIATRVGGNVEVVVHGKTGLLVPSRSPRELASAMLKLYREPELAAQLGRAGRARVESHFDGRQMVHAYESLYLQTLGLRLPSVAAPLPSTLAA